jgi:PAS domain S-box-containing protein
LWAGFSPHQKIERSERAMIKADETIEKLLTIEKAVNEMVTLRQGILEMKESEAQRQKALEELQKVGTHYRILLENLPQRIFMKDKNSVYLLCNPAYAAGLQIKPEEIAGKTDEDFYPRESAEKYRSDDRRIMATGSSESIEEVLVRDGQSFVWNTIKTPVKDENGSIVGLFGVSWDISEQRRKAEELKLKCAQSEELVAHLKPELQRLNEQLQKEMIGRRRKEEELRGAEEFRRAFENLATAAVILDENRVISLANKEFEKFSGYSKGEVEGKKKWPEFSSPSKTEGTEGFQGIPDENLEAAPQNGEYRFLDKAGNLREVSCKFGRIPETKRIVASIFDITDQKRTEEWMGSLEEKYNSLMDNTLEAIAVVQEGVIRFVSPKVLEILGYARDELTSMTFSDLIPPEDRGKIEMTTQAQDDGGPAQSNPFRVIHKDGRIRWLEGRGALIQWGKRPAALYSMTDITDRMQAKEELRSSLEPFRALVNAMDKYLFALNGMEPKKEKG